MKNLISIIIPTYNGEDFIKDCLLSIAKQEIDHEVIVIDDLSSDNTVSIAQKMGAKVIINETHKGQVAGKNNGIKAMCGDYFLTIDQDDRLKPNALKDLLKELTANNASIVMSKLEDFPETKEDEPFCHKEPFRGILTGAALFKKEVFEVIGLFDESIITGDVIDLVNRCDKHNVSIYKSDIITCERRIHGKNYGRTNQKDEYKDYAKLLRERFLEKIKSDKSK